MYELDAPLIANDTSDTPTCNNIPIWNFEQTYTILTKHDLSKNDDYYTIDKEEEYRQNNIPFPRIEYERARVISSLHQYYKNQCQTILGISAPVESFNKWIFEQLSISTENPLDPLIKDPTRPSTVFASEILAEVPMRMKIISMEKGIEALKMYHQKTLEWMKIVEDKGELQKYMDELREFLENEKELNLDKIQNKAEQVKKQCLPIFERALGEKLKILFETVTNKAKESILEFNKKKKNWKYSGQEPSITFTFNDQRQYEKCIVRYLSDRFEITVLHYNKLLTLYEMHNQNWDAELKYFSRCLYVVLRRYQTFFGPEEESGNMHAALPETGFHYLGKAFGVCQEGFASPFNCYFAFYCSAFFDTDTFFGSRGSFFDFEPVYGSFEVGPPYTIEVMDKCAEHCIKLLKNTELALSFIVFVPEWKGTKYVKLLEESEFCVGHFYANSFHHKYINGLQHLRKNSQDRNKYQRYWKIPFSTHVYFLQNKAATKEWPVTKQKMENLKRAMEGELIE